MSEPEFDSEEGSDSESMFDFLAEEGNRPRARKLATASKAEKALPIIRKPVPVSESGPLLPPKPGDPVDPPPQLTISKGDDFDFLNDGPADGVEIDDISKSVQQSQVTQLKSDRSSRPTSDMPAASNDQSLRKSSAALNDDLDFKGSGSDDDFGFGSDWNNGVHTQVAHGTTEQPSKRRWLFALASVLILAGIVSIAYTQFARWWPIVADVSLQTEASGETPVLVTEAETVETQIDSSVAQISPGTDSLEESGSNGFKVTTSPLMRRFTEQLAELDKLVDSGSLNEAEQVLATMDRTVYGYGAFEFSAVEARIAEIRNGGIEIVPSENVEAQAQRLEQEKLAQQAAQAEALRQEQEAQAQQAAQAQAQRLEQEAQAQQAAQAQALRLEQEALAQQAAQAQALRLEQEAQAQQAAQAQALRLEQEALAQQAAQAQALRLEQEALAQQAAQAQALRVEQEAQAQQAAQAKAQELEQERIAQQAAKLESAAQTSENQLALDADRLATDRRIAEQRAANQRREARELRLAQARERAAAQVQEQLQQDAATEAARAAAAASSTAAQVDEPQNNIALVDQQITDDDLQVVYKRFVSLQRAINNRDISSVISITQRSGARVQQLLQMFENSVSIDSRIRNVSTRNATGEIHGTLQINGVTRADGSVVKPPANVASISLTSRREGSGWSAISW